MTLPGGAVSTVKGESAALIEQAVIETPKDLQAELIRRGAPAYMATVLNAIKPDSRASRSERLTCLKLFHACAFGWNRDRDLLMALISRLGMRSESELDAAAETYRQMQGVSLEQAERDAVKLLKALMAADPEKKAELRRELFGAVAVNLEANGNGAHG